MVDSLMTDYEKLIATVGAAMTFSLGKLWQDRKLTDTQVKEILDALAEQADRTSDENPSAVRHMHMIIETVRNSLREIGLR